ncbi:hypothetical protein EON63_00090 [archaeon]|nr:MAG: hypothetical protein EON63_00090 [archaeon]
MLAISSAQKSRVSVKEEDQDGDLISWTEDLEIALIREVKKYAEAHGKEKGGNDIGWAIVNKGLM